MKHLINSEDYVDMFNGAFVWDMLSEHEDQSDQVDSYQMDYIILIHIMKTLGITTLDQAELRLMHLKMGI